MLAGAACSLVAPPLPFQAADEYRAQAGRLVDVARPAAVIADDESLVHLKEVAAVLGSPPPVRPAELIATGAGHQEPPGSGPAEARDPVLLQFTSGSTQAGRGVRVSAAALDANVRAIMRWVRWSPGEPAAGWLPVHHDMGLVGCLITSLAAGCDGWLMQPDQFIRKPIRYLRCLSEVGARMTAMPGFGLAYLMNRISPRQLAGLDFSALDAVIVGAERIRPQLLEAFHEFLAPFGFRREALRPAYGLAEATVCVTGVPLGEEWTSEVLPAGDSDIEVTGCGRPVDGVEVRVVDEDGQPVPDRTLGEIVVTGTSLADGYVTGDAAKEPGPASATSLADGVLRTGDAGFLSGGQLFVLGRLGDGLKIRGKMVFAESIEAALQERGVPERRAAALLGIRGDIPVAAVVLENPREGWARAVAEVLEAHAAGAELLVIAAPRGAMPVTSSGKPRRRVMWQALIEGRLPGEITTIRASRHEAAAPRIAGERALWARFRRTSRRPQARPLTGNESGKWSGHSPRTHRSGNGPAICPGPCSPLLAARGPSRTGGGTAPSAACHVPGPWSRNSRSSTAAPPWRSLSTARYSSMPSTSSAAAGTTTYCGGHSAER